MKINDKVWWSYWTLGIVFWIIGTITHIEPYYGISIGFNIILMLNILFGIKFVKQKNGE